MDSLLQKYLTFQQKTQIKEFDLKYLALGLGGEVGEVQNEIKKLERDDDNVLTENRKNKIITELGDVMWYITGICNKLDINLDQVINGNIKKLQK